METKNGRVCRASNFFKFSPVALCGLLYVFALQTALNRYIVSTLILPMSVQQSLCSLFPCHNSKSINLLLYQLWILYWYSLNQFQNHLLCTTKSYSSRCIFHTKKYREIHGIYFTENTFLFFRFYILCSILNREVCKLCKFFFLIMDFYWTNPNDKSGNPSVSRDAFTQKLHHQF